MSKLRWKWIGYHAYSNLLTLLLTAVVLYFVIPPSAWGDIPMFTWTKIVLVVVLGSVALGVICGFNFTRNIRNRLEEVSVGAKNLAY